VADPVVLAADLASGDRWIAQRVALGRGLEARVAEITRTVAIAADKTSLVGLSSPQLAKRAQELRDASSRLIAEYLITGEVAAKDQLRELGEFGLFVADEGMSLGDLVRSYYVWRESILQVLNEEGARLDTPPDILSLARGAVLVSLDAAVVRMNHNFDKRLRQVNADRLLKSDELRASEARLRGIYDTAAIGILVVAPGGEVITANAAANAIIGLLPGQMSSFANLMTNVEVVDEDGNPLLDSPSKRAIRTGRPVHNFVFRLRPRGGRERWVQCDAVPTMGTDGAVDEVIVTIADVTSFKEAEVAKQESQAKSRFLATMSHELRTPLNSILGFAQLMRMHGGDALTGQQLRYLANIESGGQNLLAIINDVLDLSKVAAGELTLSVRPFSVAGLVKECAGAFEPLVAARGLRLECDIAADLAVRADPLRARQVLMNLLSNAVKFTEHGAVSVSALGDGDEVEIQVRDTGVGIAAHQLERVFDEFTQVDMTTTRSHEGTGLGLPLSRRLAELMGGSIVLESSPAEGSLVRFRLPAAGREDAPGDTVPRPPARS
jgi:PAS domain S-box-containing protein